MKRMPTPRWDTNRLRLLLTACMILLLLGAATIAYAEVVFEEDWEAGSSALDDWTENEVDGIIEVSSTESVSGSNSLRMFADVGSHDDDGDINDMRATYDGTFPLDTSEDVNITFHVYRTGGESAAGLIHTPEVNFGSNDLQLRYAVDDSQWELSGNVMTGLSTNGTAPAPNQTFSEVNIIFPADNDQINVFYDGELMFSETQTSEFSNPSAESMYIEMEAGNIQTGHTQEVFIDDITIESTPPPVRNITLDANDYMRPNTTQYYNVVFNDDGAATDVSDHANTTVTSNNSTIVVVDAGNNSLTSNVSGVVRINASFTDSDGDVHNDSVNVTVATPTLDNWAILPSWWRITALFSWDPGDNVETNMVWIILAVLVGMSFTAIASSFAGIGVTTLIVIIGWFWGQAGGVSTVGTGVMLAALFGGLFIGLNLAANIDYAMTRGGGVEG